MVVMAVLGILAAAAYPLAEVVQAARARARTQTRAVGYPIGP